MVPINVVVVDVEVVVVVVLVVEEVEVEEVLVDVVVVDDAVVDVVVEVVVVVDDVVVVGSIVVEVVPPLRTSIAASAVASRAAQLDVCAWQSPLLCALPHAAVKLPSHFVSLAGLTAPPASCAAA
jgi:hypothetical protein